MKRWVKRGFVLIAEKLKKTTLINNPKTQELRVKNYR